jgi:hypothetical protein
VLYAKNLSFKRDLADAEPVAHAVSAQRADRKARRVFEVVLVCPPPRPAGPPGVRPPAGVVPLVTPQSPQARLKGKCKKCRCRLSFLAKLAGNPTRCPNCKARFRIPATAGAFPSA